MDQLKYYYHFQAQLNAALSQKKKKKKLNVAMILIAGLLSNDILLCTSSFKTPKAIGDMQSLVHKSILWTILGLPKTGLFALSKPQILSF